MRRRSVWSLWILLLLLPPANAYADESPYTVKEKETLFAIAKRNQVPVDVLCRINAIQDPSRIKSGTVLKIPRSVTVGKGDTLFAISRRFGISLDGILELNGLPKTAMIKAGDRIFLPPSADQTAVTASGTPPAANSTPKPEAVVTDPGKSQPSTPKQGTAAAPERRVAFWPHPGKKEALRGKVTGFAFYGKEGDDVLSATQGEVSWVGPYWGLGKVIIVRTGDGDYILYAGNETLLVNKGDAVNAGMPIARLGMNPAEGVAKLFFSIRTASGAFVEPERISKG